MVSLRRVWNGACTGGQLLEEDTDKDVHTYILIATLCLVRPSAGGSTQGTPPFRFPPTHPPPSPILQVARLPVARLIRLGTEEIRVYVIFTNSWAEGKRSRGSAVLPSPAAAVTLERRPHLGSGCRVCERLSTCGTHAQTVRGVFSARPADRNPREERTEEGQGSCGSPWPTTARAPTVAVAGGRCAGKARPGNAQAMPNASASYTVRRARHHLIAVSVAETFPHPVHSSKPISRHSESSSATSSPWPYRFPLRCAPWPLFLRTTPTLEHRKEYGLWQGAAASSGTARRRRLGPYQDGR